METDVTDEKTVAAELPETRVDMAPTLTAGTDELSIPISMVAVIEARNKPSKRRDGRQVPMAQALNGLSHTAWGLLSGDHASEYEGKLARQLGKLAVLASRTRGVELAFTSESCARIGRIQRLLEELVTADDLGHRRQLRFAEQLRDGRKKLERLLGL